MGIVRTNLICVIGDVVDSRKVEHRDELQNRFRGALEGVNHASARQLASPCTITLGDEYQAVYKSAAMLFMDFMAILGALHPHQLRFSVGIGKLATPINVKQALGMDGPAFHVARDGMAPAFKKSDSLFLISHAERAVPGWINASLALVSHEIGTWKQLRFEIFKRHLANQSAKEISKALEISNKAVYKNIHGGALEPLAALILEIERWMTEETKK